VASREVRAWIKYAVSGRRRADNRPRERARHGIGVVRTREEELGPDSEGNHHVLGECAMIYDLVERVTATVRRECQVASDEEAKTMAANKITRDIRRMSSTTARSTPTRCRGVGNHHVLGECDTNYDEVK
jgi:hypothetical protein